MNRIDQKFENLREGSQKALITYVTAGDPELENTKALVLEMAQKGADLIEIGIPYSDPVADGPVIEKAAQRALSQKIKIKDIMEIVKEIRKASQVPLLYLVYFNCILQYGVEAFVSDCKNVGIDGLIVPDLPFEESAELRAMGEQYDIRMITLIAPTSKDRIQKIVQGAKGFIYCISSMGVTGTRDRFSTNFMDFIEEIGKYSDIPKAIGFGISTPAQIRQLKDYCDAMIVGSAIVKVIEKYGDSEGLVQKVGEFVGTLKKGMA